MGVGNLHIGENLGGAQIFNTPQAIQQYGQLLATRKAKVDADNKYLADQLSSVKTDGLRNDADRVNFFKKYSDLKQQAIDAENEKDPMKKALAIANVRTGMTGLNDYVNQSKQQAVKENQFAQAYMANPTAFSDSAIDAHRESIGAAVDSNDTVKDYTTLARQVDPNKIEQEQKGIEQEMLKNTQWQNPTQFSTTIDGRPTTFLQNKRTVNTADLYENALHRFDAKGDFEHYIRQSFPDLFANNNPTVAKALAIKQYIDGRGSVGEYPQPTKQESPIPRETNAEKEELHRANRNYDINHPRPGQAISNQQTPAQTLIVGDPAKGIKGLQQNDPAAMEKFLNLLPKGQYGKVVPQQAIDPQTGEQLYNFPAHIDAKAVEFNNGQKAKWEKENPGEPFDPTDKDYKLKPEVLAPAKGYKINPASPDYLARMAELAKEQNVNLSQLNNIEGVKGGHGQIPQAQQKPTGKTPKQVSSQQEYDALPKGAQYIAPNGKVYIKK